MGITTMKWKGMGITMAIRKNIPPITRGWIPTFGRHHAP